MSYGEMLAYDSSRLGLFLVAKDEEYRSRVLMK